MKFGQKQIWLVNFDPSFGHEYQKMRPGIIIENNSFIDSYDLLTIVPLSSNIKVMHSLDILIPKTSKNRLMLDSLIKTKQINTYDKRRFIKLIGVCDDEIFAKIKENIGKYLA